MTHRNRRRTSKKDLAFAALSEALEALPPHGDDPRAALRRAGGVRVNCPPGVAVGTWRKRLRAAIGELDEQELTLRERYPQNYSWREFESTGLAISEGSGFCIVWREFPPRPQPGAPPSRFWFSKESRL